jgi:hypothetical protein
MKPVSERSNLSPQGRRHSAECHPEEIKMKHIPVTPDQVHPWAAPMKRRTVLMGMTATAVTLGLSSLPGVAMAKAATSTSLDVRTFYQASQVLTGYDDLDPVTAQRISTALIAQDPAIEAALITLGTLVKSPDNQITAEALLAAAKQAGVGDAALAVVAAWFKGTVGHGQSAVLVAYREALMYRPASDGLIVPTYCGNGPLWWTAPIPDANAPLAGPRTAL